jgi:DNA-directed RNA polymerase subunit M/transcription elongation factor TFIIS
MASEETRCPICEAYFRPEAIVKNKHGVKVCTTCADLYPNARTKDDIKVEAKNKAPKLDEAFVRDIVYGILRDANIKRIECERCGDMFFPHGPMQKVCQKCKNVVEKEAK